MDSALPFSAVPREPGGDGTATPPPSEGVPILTPQIPLQPFQYASAMLHEGDTTASTAWHDLVVAWRVAETTGDVARTVALGDQLARGGDWEAAQGPPVLRGFTTDPVTGRLVLVTP